MPRRTNRREFLQTSAALGAGFWIANRMDAQQSKSPNEKIRFGCIGVGDGHKGGSDSAHAGDNGDVVAICDIDDKLLAGSAEKFPAAKKYNDFRKMYDEMGKSIDAVTVSTPDHCHAVAAAAAFRLGKHAYVQKPLTHSIYEARTLAKLARDNKVITQMGNQGTAGDALRRVAGLIQQGVIGKVSEVHVWTNRPDVYWAQGLERPAPSEPPASVHWDLWLGPAKERPYGEGYQPFTWRAWWDFGTGALGDMACHTINMPYMALELHDPTSIEATTSGHNRDSFPKWSVIKFQFPSTDKRPAVAVNWYDGGKFPPAELYTKIRAGVEADLKKRYPNASPDDVKAAVGRGATLIGDKGMLHAHGDYCNDYTIMGTDQPAIAIESEDFLDAKHFKEFADAIRAGKQPKSNIPDYAAGLTETVLLGNLAVWMANKPEMKSTVNWDPKQMKAVGAPEVDPIIQPQFRAGWTM